VTRPDPLPPPSDKEAYVHAIFSDIAPRYDFLNSLLSLRFDRRWRKAAARMARVSKGSAILDICCGTGELAFALSDAAGGGPVIASDFVQEMLVLGREKAARRNCPQAFIPVLANALSLPFPDGSFDAVTVAFGIRNVSDIAGGLAEMARVAKPGGRVVVLDFTQPRSRLFRSLYYFYFRRILPRVGNTISKNRDAAYSYLPASVLAFPDVEGFAALMRSTSLTNVRYRTLTLGIVAVHVGEKAA